MGSDELQGFKKTDEKTYQRHAAVPPYTAPEEFRKECHVSSREQYDEMYKRSIEDPEGFWGNVAEEFHWEKKWEPGHFSYNFDVRKGKIFTSWFKGATTNISYNCLDKHVKEGRGDQTCILWEGNEIGRDKAMTYKEVLEETCRLANWLRSVGVMKGDAVCIYMPMLPELPIAMLACARIGAVHSVVFAGFSSESLAQRIEDCKSNVVITCNAVMRGAKRIDLKKIVDKGLSLAKRTAEVEHVLVYENTDALAAKDTAWEKGRDKWYGKEVPGQAAEAEVEWVDAEDPLFLLYTSGSTGRPKGVLHTTGGYMLAAATTTKYAFDLRPGDIYWCTADCGWITGHTYLTYGPLLNGAINVVFEGVPTYPSPSRCWEIVEKYKVKQFYTAPTLIRSLMGAGAQHVTKHDRSSLRVLGTVGEPINPEAWRWYFDVVGEKRCPIVDTWWQTETGAHMIMPLPGGWTQKPGSATLPFFGVVPAVVDEKGTELEGACEGYLCIKQAWPSTIRTVYGDQDRYETTYFAPFKGFYFSGDGCRRDEDGYYWITGRVDDVINVSGHRIGTAEVESALVGHSHCSEAAVVGFEHPVKGQGIYAYVTLDEGVEATEELRKELVMAVREEIGAFAAPDVIHWAPGLPKTRSGKIMRRVLRKIAAHEESELGDTSTLADPSIVDQLLENRPPKKT
jgi:acetyl-CoA synthetase